MSFIEILSTQPAALIGSTLLLGLIVGSFINVVAHRLPVMMSRDWQAQARAVLDLPEQPAERFNLMYPASRCPHCERPVRARENIPVLGWLLLHGQCTGCSQPISIRYPLVELACGLLSAGIAWHFGFTWQTAALLPLTWGLLAMSLIDADHHLLPDALVLPLLWLGLIVNYWGVFASLPDALWGAVGGYLSLWSLYWAFKLVTGKDGMGYGDFKLLALIGAWGGWQALPWTILLASALGAIFGLLLQRLRHTEGGTPIPFGPYLAIAGGISLIWGEAITRHYLAGSLS